VNNRKRILFVCIGNACRSQMAEAFARTYGSDVLIPASVGLAPAVGLPPDTVNAMAEKNIDVSAQFPKGIRQLRRAKFDLVVNMSGYSLPWENGAPTEKWPVPDPVSMGYEEHCQVRDQIEALVMKLILDLRQKQKDSPRNPGN
jgi:protein-tyrosine-phosphatase